MSWLSDDIARKFRDVGELGRKVGSALGLNDYANFMQSEIEDKSALRGAEIEGVLSGVPIVGDVVRGLNGVQQMEDLYANTGKVVNYPGGQNLGTSSLAHVPGDISRKIEGGSHDLAEFYSGDRDINKVFDRINGSLPLSQTSKSGETGWTKVI